MLNIKNGSARFSIKSDCEHIRKIVDDIEVFGDELQPSDHWNFNLNNPNKDLKAYTKDLYDEKYDTLEKLLDPWVVSEGMQPIRMEVFKKYEIFFKTH